MSGTNDASRGQKRAAKSKKREQKRHGTVISLDRARRTAVDEYERIVPSFHSWLLDSDMHVDEEVATTIVLAVAEALAMLDPRASGFSATAWRPSDIEFLFTTLPDDPDEADDAAIQIAGAVAAYFAFLGESDLWTGSDEDLISCGETLTDYVEFDDEMSPLEVPPFEVPVPDIDPDVERAALAALPIIARMSALLDWIGRSRPVTPTGALKLAAIPEAAALFGQAVTTGRAASQPGLFGDSDASDAEPVRVQSMWEVPGLSEAWAVAVRTDLLRTGSTVAKPGPAAELWRNPDADPDTYLETLRNVVAATISARFGRSDTGLRGDFTQIFDDAAIQVMVMGFGDHPVPADPDVRRAALESAPEGLSDLLEVALGERIDALVADGLLDNTDVYRVPDALKPAVHRALSVLAGELVITRPGPRYTMKVSLLDTQPPVWRRLVVDSGMTLPDLHDAIQTAYAWDDSHLHRFDSGRSRVKGRSYLPADQIDDGGFFDSNTVVEDAVAIAEALPKVGSKLTYLYDYGDGWEHEIIVESIGEIDESSPRATCIAGSGMAPVEDSGGPWGWSQLVATANDPKSEGYEEIREWLGVAAGEQIDPTMFDVNEANTRLRRLFR